MEDQERPIVERIPCEQCGGPTHMDDVLTTDGLIPHQICDHCGYKWVPEIVYQEQVRDFAKDIEKGQKVSQKSMQREIDI